MEDLIDLLQNVVDSVAPVLIIVCLLILIWFGGVFLKSMVRRLPKIPPEGKNALNLGISITQILFFGFVAFTLLGASQELILGFSAILATVIGFASTSIATNLYGGLYLIITRPFHVGDLIQAQEAIGIVEEIGLTFTRIVQLDKTIVLIPNSNLLNVSLLNYNTRSPSDQKKQKEGFNALNTIKVISTELYFDSRSIKLRRLIQLQLNAVIPPISLTEVNKRLKKVCEEFAPIFGQEPTYYFGKSDYRQNTYLLITAPDAYTIFNTWPYLMESIMETVFAELQEGS
ncbi:MAG: mechanosensitive ion channel domain-containing protein [Candidatus Hodarchaeales archaeon]